MFALSLDRATSTIGPPLEPMRRETILHHLAALLEQQLNQLDALDASSGITDESFDDIPTASFAVPRPEKDALEALPVCELKRLADAHRLDGIIKEGSKKAELVALLTSLACAPCEEGAPAAATDTVPRRVSQPSQCTICMNDFREDDELKVLPCSELHCFHTSCIQQWLCKQASCPLCRNECGERRPPPPPPDPLVIGESMISQLSGPDGPPIEHAFFLVDTGQVGNGANGGGGSVLLGLDFGQLARLGGGLPRLEGEFDSEDESERGALRWVGTEEGEWGDGDEEEDEDDDDEEEESMFLEEDSDEEMSSLRRTELLEVDGGGEEDEDGAADGGMTAASLAVYTNAYDHGVRAARPLRAAHTAVGSSTIGSTRTTTSSLAPRLRPATPLRLSSAARTAAATPSSARSTSRSGRNSGRGGGRSTTTTTNNSSTSSARNTRPPSPSARPSSHRNAASSSNTAAAASTSHRPFSRSQQRAATPPRVPTPNRSAARRILSGPLHTPESTTAARGASPPPPPPPRTPSRAAASSSPRTERNDRTRALPQLLPDPSTTRLLPTRSRRPSLRSMLPLSMGPRRSSASSQPQQQQDRARRQTVEV